MVFRRRSLYKAIYSSRGLINSIDYHIDLFKGYYIDKYIIISLYYIWFMD